MKPAPEKAMLRIIWLMLCSLALVWACDRAAWFIFWEPALPVLLMAYLLLLYAGFKLINKLHYGGC